MDMSLRELRELVMDREAWRAAIPSEKHPELISFRMDWLDLLAVQGTLKSLLQHHSSKASILRHSAFFTVQLKVAIKGRINCSISAELCLTSGFFQMWKHL